MEFSDNIPLPTKESEVVRESLKPRPGTLVDYYDTCPACNKAVFWPETHDYKVEIPEALRAEMLAAGITVEDCNRLVAGNIVIADDILTLGGKMSGWVRRNNRGEVIGFTHFKEIGTKIPTIGVAGKMWHQPCYDAETIYLQQLDKGAEEHKLLMTRLVGIIHYAYLRACVNNIEYGMLEPGWEPKIKTLGDTTCQ